MKNFWTIVFAAFVLCELARGSVQVEQASPDWDEGLGIDLCPECRPLTAPPLPRVAPSPSGNSQQEQEEALGVDMCPECRPLPPLRPLVREVSSYSFKEVDRGMDTCPECRPLLPPTMSTAIPSKLDDAGLGVDMWPECNPLPRPSTTVRPKGDLHEEDFEVEMCPNRAPLPSGVPQSAASHKQTPDEDLGADMCPECRPLPPLVRTPDMMLREEDLGTDMCPEKSQPMSVDESHLVRPVAAGSKNVVKELQQLMKMQQQQIDQLADVLQQLGKIHKSVPMEQLRQDSSRMSAVRVADDEMSERQPSLPDALPIDSRQQQQKGQMVLDSSLGEISATPQTGVASAAAIAQGIVGGGERGMTIARYRPAWSEHFSFLSAVKVDGEVSCLHVLPQEGDDGISRYVVVGDTAGRLYIFQWLGDHLLDHSTLSTAPITAMLSYTLQKNETILVTGHSDGAVLVHRVWERVEQGSISNDGRTTLYSIGTLHCLVPPPPGTSRSGFKNAARVDDQSVSLSEKAKEERMSVTILDMYKVGKMRYTLVGDTSGKIQVFRDNGSLHGVAQSPTRPLAFMRAPSPQRLVFLTEAGMGLLDLRSMHVRSSLCEGLNTSTMEAYAFDVNGRTKAHGFTSQGDLVSVALTGDMRHFECHVKKKRKVDVTGPFVPQALKGYLIAATPDRVVVFNTTMQTGSNSYANFWVPGPTPLFSATMKEIAISFLPTPIKRSHFPILASNRDRLVVVGFGDGYVAIFRSNLPTTRAADFSARFWNSSVLVSGLVLLVVWQLFTRKRDPAAVASPEYPLVVAPSGTTGTGTAAASSYDKEENVRLGFGQTRKGEPRRFRSPTRGYVDPNPASFGDDSSRRFRSSAVDTDVTGYSTRREPLFSSTQPVGELGVATIDNR